MFISVNFMKIYFSPVSKAFFAISIYVILFLAEVNAQQKPLYFKHSERIAASKCVLVDLEKPATSATVQWLNNSYTKGFYIYADGEKYFVERDADAEEINGKVFSHLVVFPSPISTFTVCSEDYHGEITMHFLQVPYIAFDKNAFKQKRNKTGCKKPVTVDQDIWRAGLAAPTVTPAAHKVTHIIVHHTATPNSQTDYVNVVRNIYLYHTEVNGWDDIGYNFLVAPDGIIFQGRDGMGVDEDDNIRGAHFCGKNTNTMGISMIGDYQQVAPTDTSLQALEQLIAWKMNKENIEANENTIHNGVLLNTISGHRDGCATECPGDSVYVRLPQVRNEVDILMEDCMSPTIGIAQKHFSGDVYMQYNHTGNEVNIRSDKAANYTFTLVDLQGKIWKSGNINVGFEAVSARDLPNGIYILQLNNSQGKNTLKFVKM